MTLPAEETRGNQLRLVAAALGLSAIAFSLTIAGGLEARHWIDRSQLVEASRLGAALVTFRPSDLAGQPHAVDLADLAPGRSMRTAPRRCAPLTLLAVRTPLGGEAWTGISGSPAQPVNTLTVRYSATSSARADLREKRIALLRCRTVLLTFPPYDKPAQAFTVSDRALSVWGDRIEYALTAGSKRYDFYVRQYANTLTWTYGDDASTPAVRRRVADDLVARLKDIARER